MDQEPYNTAFSHLLISGTVVHEAGFEDLQHKFGIHVRPNTVMVVSIDRYPDLALGKPLAWRMLIGRQIVQSVQDSIKEPFLRIWAEEGVLAVLLELSLEHPLEKNYEAVTRNIARKIQRHASSRGVSVSIGIGTYCDNPYLLQYSYEEAKESMVDRFFQGNRLIFHYEKKRSTNTARNHPLSSRERIELLARVRIGDKGGTVTLLKNLMEKLAQVHKYNVNMFKSEVVDLVMSITRIVIESGADAATVLSENAKFIQGLYSTIRYDKFEKKVCDYVDHLATQVEDPELSSCHPLIGQAVRYMKENLDRAVSLREVAQYCCLSVYYFSRLFKKETRCSFVDYLNKIRLEKALYYLETTDFTVQQVAMHVGFQDANYFSRIFKKYMNTTPTEYRKAKLC
ncbi:AraC family transcriptional regulator [Effusibacillus lacus]|uniref:AraC family transcriptional regulator n=1 Tax=Effusibacillus lacus TaxID=1348429 RepID=A0A292YKF8_9BACL|nr:helix-turn-helix domain-containing protein [Effusibacillus lacus]TCS75495.1 two-component system response regulator YesN [Effusibacillus lacus]GAX88960.1 AraC family transcriptional regulator [Effusibacillus lacus]